MILVELTLGCQGAVKVGDKIVNLRAGPLACLVRGDIRVRLVLTEMA